ncbi:MAG: hypothetical protein EOO43_07830 [Flavobacterium sp.]|nr:MAG: hypothetical protein EOO43_07830 [Flavobacterium sp.]
MENKTALLSRLKDKFYSSLNKFSNSNKQIVKNIPIDKILRGSEGDALTGLEYIRMTGDKFRPSTRVIDGPQVKLLQEYLEIGESLFEPEIFENTLYYKNALESIHYLGDYFDAARDPQSIIKVARRYVDSFMEKDLSKYSHIGHNDYNEKIVVRPIINSDCYQIVSGNHRVASNFIKGNKEIGALVNVNENTHTYFTELIDKVVWDQGKELYHPIPLPEMSNMILIRKCADRFEKMMKYLKDVNFDLNTKSVIDIGSYYGWFVDQFKRNGAHAFGLERDFSACRLSMELHSLKETELLNKPLEDFIENDTKNYDIMIFLSVLHHFALKKSYLTAEYVIKKLSEKTNDIMFFDTGEEHETMFNSSLKGWNEKTITDFILNNSDFTEVIPLGRDEDGVGKYIGNYQRMLFVLKK